MMPFLSRRRFNQLLLGVGAAGALPRLAFAQVPADTPLHGLSAFGELKYGLEYQAFDYANPDAPLGGRMNMTVPNWILNQSPQTFDTLNTFTLQGNAPPRIEMLYDALMVGTLDEPSSLYCALAESVTIAPDRNSFIFRLRSEAVFSTGAPVTAEDVAFSYVTFKEKGHPSLVIALEELTEVVAEDARTVRLVFSGRQDYQDVLDTLAFPVVAKAFFDTRDFLNTDFEEIPGSGAYRVGRFEPGRYIEYEKRDDYWARDMPFARGLNHFQTLRIDFFRDRTAAFEAFKTGLITWREEFTSKSWATRYDFPAVTSGKVIKRTFPGERRPSFQCWAPNQRRPRFADPNVRRAINLCFDFEWANVNMFYGQYEHSDSCFEHSEFKAEGLPSDEELALLEPLRGQIPEEAFGEPWVQPVSDGSGQDRDRLREAVRLMGEAGWTIESGQMRNEAGEIFELEFLINDPGFERVYGKFIQTLQRIGVNARFRLVDPSQYQARLTGFDFDMVGGAFSLGATPTRDTLRGLFGSDTSDLEGSNNYPGMAVPAVDTLIEAVSNAESREELTTAMRALDRVLRARLDWIPNINTPEHRVAYWDMFGFKEPKPDYGFPVEALWWFDEDKAKAIGQA